MPRVKKIFKEICCRAVKYIRKTLAVAFPFLKKHWKKFFYGITAAIVLVMVLIVLRLITPPVKTAAHVVVKYSRQLWKEIVCEPGSDKDFCRNKCGQRDPAAEWCDCQQHSLNVPVDGMISYVAEGGCAIAAITCADDEKCLTEAWTCMAECSPDPNRVITKKGCECQGNWTPYEKQCVCRDPFIMKNGECVPVPKRECDNDVEESGSLFECTAPLQEVKIFWRGKYVYGCQGSCYSLLCVSNDSIPMDDYRYYRGKFYDVIPAERGNLKSYFPAMGGYYGVCRVPL